MDQEESERRLATINLGSLKIATDEEDDIEEEDDPDMPSMVQRQQSDSEDDEPPTSPFNFAVKPTTKEDTSKTTGIFDTPAELPSAKPKSKKNKRTYNRSRKKKQSPSTNKSLAAKSDTPKKSANSFSALSEEQDFR